MQRKSIFGGIFRWLLLLFGLVPAVLLAMQAGIALWNFATAPVLLSELTVEAGTETVPAGDFLTASANAEPTYLAGVSREQLRTPGSYPVSITCSGRHYDAVIHVVDTVAPTGSTVDISSLERMPEAWEFLTEVRDITEVTVAYAETPDMTLNGTQPVTLVLTDTSGNQTTLTAALTLDLDLTPPEITGVRSFLVYQGDTLAYRTGISVTDNRDPAPVLSIDSGKVDLGWPGVYTLTYRATDASGNTAVSETTVTVLEKQHGYVALETVYATADAVLSQIIRDNMTAEDKAKAVFQWIGSHCYYVETTTQSDYYQAAYSLLTQRKGSSFHFASLSRLLLERLEIPNMDVCRLKVQETDTDYYWNLVSVDGGETWYHFDSVPQTEANVSFFLVTDTYLDEYSQEHENFYNRDAALYPATP